MPRERHYIHGNYNVILIGAKLVGQEETTDWYFEDNFHQTMNLEGLMIFATFGKTFLDGVYKAENYFKTLEEPKIVTKEEYLQKSKSSKFQNYRH